MTKALLLATLAGAVLWAVLVPEPAPPAHAAVKPRPPDVQWLSREAAKQLVADDGGPGPLFDGASVGGSPPASAVRARIAAFARANHVAIAFEVADDQLAAIRVEVTYGGCCGYEGADVLALRLRRPRPGGCTCEHMSPNDWSFTTPAGVHARARVRVATVGVRWESQLSAAELVARAHGLLGKHVADVRRAAGDRWIELEHGRTYLLEVPYTFTDIAGFCLPIRVEARTDLGLRVTAERGTIIAVSYVDGATDERVDYSSSLRPPSSSLGASPPLSPRFAVGAP